MRFEEALKIMKDGNKVKLPSWGGFWKWDSEKESIIMHTKDGEELDIRETQVVEYTLGNILSDEWIVADENNWSRTGRRGDIFFRRGNQIFEERNESCT